MNAIGVITLVAGWSVLAAFVTKGIDFWGEQRKRRVEADFAALYLVNRMDPLWFCIEHLIRSMGCEMSARNDGSAHWSDQEVDEAAFKNARLGRRFADLLKQLGDGMGKQRLGEWVVGSS